MNCFTVFVTVACYQLSRTEKVLKGTAAHRTMPTTSSGPEDLDSHTTSFKNSAAMQSVPPNSSSFQWSLRTYPFSQSCVLPLSSLSPTPSLLEVPIFFFSPIMTPNFQDMPLPRYNPILLVGILPNTSMPTPTPSAISPQVTPCCWSALCLSHTTVCAFAALCQQFMFNPAC